jgi:hypothetical protein
MGASLRAGRVDPVAEMTAAGVLLGTAGLRPTAEGAPKP